SPLPPGLTLSDSGVLSGNPTTAGFYGVTLSVSDGISTIYRWITLTVSPIQITTPGALPNATQGQAYTPVQLNASPASANYRWTASYLPAGMSLGPTGELSGTPQWAGNFAFDVTVKDTVTGQSYTKHFALNIVGVPVVLPTITNPV